MKNFLKTITIFCFLIISTMFISCDNATTSQTEQSDQTEQIQEFESHVLTTLDNSVEVYGDAGGYLELIDSEIILTQTNEREWSTNIRIKIVDKTDNSLYKLYLILLDENGKQLYDFESKIHSEILETGNITSMLYVGEGFNDTRFLTTLKYGFPTPDEFEQEEKMKAFEDNISKAVYYKVIAVF